jgi:hypothetical protein
MFTPRNTTVSPDSFTRRFPDTEIRSREDSPFPVVQENVMVSNIRMTAAGMKVCLLMD